MLARIIANKTIYVSAYTYLINQIKTAYPKFAYFHLTEDNEVWRGQEIVKPRSNDPFRALLREPSKETGEHEAPFAPAYPDPDEKNPTVFISCGDYRTTTSIKLSQAKGDVVAIGRNFISK